MKSPLFFATLLAFSTLSSLPAQQAPQATSLFDGRTLESWDFDPKVWRVEDGVITGGSRTSKVPKNYFIATKQSYQNFDLKLTIKCSGDPKTGLINSGIQIRSLRVPGGAHVAGYQIDCGKGWFGKIYDEYRRRRVIAEPVDAEALAKVVNIYGWNEYRIRAEGPKIQVWINGVLATDYTEKDPNIALNGVIAPQVHSGGAALVQVKNVSIVELPPTPGAPSWESLGGLEAALKKAPPAPRKRNPNVKDTPQARQTDKIPAPPKGDGRVTFDFESGDLQGWYIVEGWFNHLIADNKTVRAGGGPSNKEGKYFLGTLEAAPGGVTGDPQTGIVESPVFQLTGPGIQFAVSGGGHPNTYVGLYTLDGKEVRKASGKNSETFQPVTWNVPELVGKPVFVRLVDQNNGGWGHVTMDAFSAEGKLLPAETKKRIALAKPKKPSAKELAAANAKRKRPGKKTQSARTTAKSAEEQLAGFTVPEGFVIELVASEEHGVINPIDLSFDDAGRLWTQTAQMYPLDPISGMKWQQFLDLMKDEKTQNTHPEFKRIKDLYQLKTKGDDKILILDDPTQPADDPLHVWADGLAIPQSILPYKDGAYVCHGSELFLLRDTNGDGKSDKMEPVLSGFGFTDTHTMSHLLVRGPGSYIHFSQGALNQGLVTAVESGFQDRIDAACQVRFGLDHQDFEVLSAGPSNMWGLQLRANGQWYGTEANDRAYCVIPWEHGAAVTGAAFRPMRPYQPLLPELHDFRVGGTGISGLEFSEDTEGGFPYEDWKDVALLANPITSTINAVRVHRNTDGTVEAEHLPDFLSSDDDWFRPVNLEFGPDGCLYIADFYNKIVSHNEVTTDHPDRDKLHGRIWRIRHESQKPRKIPDVTQAAPRQLLVHLQAPSLWEKRAAWQQIADRELKELAPELVKLSGDDQQTVTTRIHALWSLEELKHFDSDLIDLLLACEDGNLRREAVRSIASFGLDPAKAAALATPFVDDKNAMVRSQAIRTLGDLGSPHPAVFAGLIAACKPSLGNNELGGGYERNLERFLARMALERFPAELKSYLDKSSGSHSAGNLLWAIQALDDEARQEAFLGIWSQVKSQPMDSETFIAISGMLNNPEVFRAVQPIFQDPAKAKNLVGLAIANQSRVQSKKLNEMLIPMVKQVLTNPKTVELGLKAVGKFRITSLGPDVAKIPPMTDDLVTLRLLLGAQAISPKLNVASFISVAGNSSLPFDVRTEALHALAAANQEEANRLSRELLSSANSFQKGQFASLISPSKAGGALLCSLSASGALTPDVFDLSAAERVVQSHPSNPEAKKIIASARKRVAEQRRQAQEKIHSLMSYISRNPGDPEKGKITFGSCLTCHKVGSEGQDIAPPLDGSGHRDLEHLLTAIVDPDAAVEGGYGLYRITKTDGSVMEGYLDKKEALGTTVAMMGGARMFIPQTEIKSENFVGGRSFMPPAFGQLPEATMADLVAYIGTLKEGEAPTPVSKKKPIASDEVGSVRKGLILDLNADHGVEVDEEDRVSLWRNQASEAVAKDFVKQDKGRKVAGSGRPSLLRNVDALNGRSSIQFLQQELVCMEEDTFDHLTTGSGCTWFAVISVREQRVGLKDVNSFFGNLKNSMPYGGVWGAFTDDNRVWWGMRNGLSFGRFDKNNPQQLGPRLEVGRYYVIAGRIGEGTGMVGHDLFVDSAKAVATTQIPVNPESNPSKMAVGQERDAIEHPGKESFDGEIARFQIFERPLTNDEIGVQISALRKYYGLSEESAGTAVQPTTQQGAVPDSTGSSHAALPVVSDPKPKTGKQPNIILIFTDDQGYEDLGCFGSKTIKTPHIDKMAEAGLKLTNFYAQPVCGVSRASLMTGSYPIRVAELRNIKQLHTVPHPQEITMAEVLKSAGYATGIVGKWHLAEKGAGPGGFTPKTMPNAQGFDYFYGTPRFNGFTVYVEDTKVRSPIMHNQEVVVDAVQSWDNITADYTEKAIDYIEENQDKPFFLYLAHNMPHIPVGASEKFKGKSEYGPYGDTIEEIDWSTGKILDKLKELEIDENTLVIFTSDNGPWVETTSSMAPGGKPFIPRDHSGSAAPLRGWKMSAWDGGSKVPFVAHWPGKIERGRESNELLSTMDLLPTFATLAGVELPGSLEIDGHDATEFLLGESDASPRKDYYYYSGCLLTGVRVNEWKLVLPRPANPKGTGWWGRLIEEIPEPQLYHLEDDPGEASDIASQHPDIVSRLMDRVKKVRSELGDMNAVGTGARSFDPEPRSVPGIPKKLKFHPVSTVSADNSSTKDTVTGRKGDSDKQPNFIVIFTDDQGYQDLGSYGSPDISTPNLDRMAREGMRFTSFYAQTICGPSRTALMTSSYPLRVAQDKNRNEVHPVVHSDEITIAEVLRTVGYRSAAFGKWDLATHSQANWIPELMPRGQGFDYFFGTPSSNDRVVHLVRNEGVVEGNADMATLTKRYTDEAIEYIEKNKDGPFFVYLAHSMPHTRLAASNDFRGKSKGGFYGDVIEEIDHHSGRILEKVRELGIDDNTYVIFTSDNGPWLLRKEHGGHALPLRSGKTTCWEGGVRVPCIVRAPGRVPAGRACDLVTSTMDILPTFAALAGAGIPTDRAIDGVDISKVWHGEQTQLDRTFFYYQHHYLRGVRKGEWKIMLKHREGPRSAVEKWAHHVSPKDATPLTENLLFNLKNDIGETTDLSTKHPDKLREMLELAEWARGDIGDFDQVGENARFFDEGANRLGESVSAGKKVNPPAPSASAPSKANAAPKKKPNFVIIFTDDQGYGDLSCFGGKHVSTPRIDQMAAEGSRLTSFYVAAPVCTPSRAALMTGSYPKRVNMATGSNFGVLLAGDSKGLNPDEITIAEVLKGAGYKTGMFGKWHLGDQPEFLPTRQGFDEFFGIPFSHDIHPFHPQAKWNFPPLALLDQEEVIEMDPDADFLTKRFTEKAVDFIKENSDEPFFVYLPHPIPHKPLHVSPSFMEGVDPAIIEALDKEGERVDYKTRDKLFRQAINEIDWSVGRILDTLKEEGVDENTLVIFFSDNGPAIGSAGPLKGRKGSTFEGGMREPTVIRWPGSIPAGKDNHELMTAMDLLPTFARLAGAEVPKNRVIDGKDVWPVLAGEAASPHDAFFYHGGNSLKAVRSGHWKLHWAKGKPTQLYNLEVDIGEKSNLLKKEPAVAARLLGLLEEFERDIANNNRPAAFVENPKPLSIPDTPTPKQKAPVSAKASQPSSVKSAAKPAPGAPNVIFMLTDDLGYSDVSCYGSKHVETPHIDRLASEGIRFTDFHTAASICSPSRAAFLTGAYPQRTGLYMGINPNRKAHWYLGLNPEEITITEQFKQQGYATYMVGKWHLGTEPEFLPRKQGFDHYYGMPCNFSHSPKFFDDDEEVFAKTPLDQLTTLYTERVIRIIKEAGDKPFFLYYSHNYPHTPYAASKPFKGSSGDGVRGDIMQELDWGVGEMMKALEEAGIADNTIVIFTSDNGPTANKYAIPYRGTKYVTFEGGHRVPFIFHWPAGITEGSVSSENIHAMDLFPTLSEIIKAPMPTDRVYDGESLMPLLTGASLKRKNSEPFYFYNCENLQAVRAGDWKLHLPRTAEQLPFWEKNKAFANLKQPVLYNVATDGAESTNVAAEHPEIVERLNSLAESTRKELGEFMQRGEGQRPTGSLFPELPVISHEKDWGLMDPEMVSSIQKERLKRYPN